MKKANERVLWRLRFKRILQLEEESFEFYKKLLKEKAGLLEKAGMQPTLKEIMRDEGRHIRIAKDLLKFTENKKRGKAGRP